MNKRQKEVIAASLEDEKVVLKALEKNYTTALADIKRNIKELQANPLTQSKAYQLEFQKQLEKQLSGIIDNLQGKNFSSVADYLNTCYNQSFLGSMYDMHGQGVPLTFPIDQKQVLKAIQKTGDDIKLSTKFGGNTEQLKKDVLSELQRGLATELSYTDIARNISNRGQADMNRSIRIARTEGHRVQSEAKMDAYNTAKKKGANIVKQWDATLDGKTRETHRKLDGQIAELDMDFEIAGMKAQYPGGFRNPSEDCNCRCCLLQRARWALDEDELKTLQERAEYFGLDKSDSFEDFKKKYLNAVENLGSSDIIESELGKFKAKLRSDTSMSKEYYSAVKEKFSHGSDTAKEVFNKFIPENSVTNSHFEGTPHYDKTTKKISMHYNSDLKGERGSCVTWFHEHGHMLDDMAGNVSNNSDFVSLLNSDYLAYMKEYGKKNGLKTFDKVQAAISMELSSMREYSAVSDILQGISKGNIQGVAGHREGYWTDDSVICGEAFAHMFEAQFDDVRYAQMKKYFPNALAKFESILGGLI